MKIIDTVVFAFHPFLVAGYDIDFLSVSLLEKDNSTTCQDKSHGNKIFITWLNRPPCIYNDRYSATERNHSRGVQPGGAEEKPAFANETKLKGIVHELFNKGLKICWVIEDPKSMIYNTNATEDLQQLDQLSWRKKLTLLCQCKATKEANTAAMSTYRSRSRQVFLLSWIENNWSGIHRT